MAHSHHGRRTHLQAVGHGRIRHERFGSSNAQTPAASQPSGDGQNAGTVTSVQNNRVTITLNNTDRSTVTGMLTSATETKCEAPQQDQMQTEDRGDGSGDNSSANSGDNGPNNSGDNSGDNSGENSGDNSGNDNGDAGDNQGDGQAQMCTLATGMVVRHAELDVSSAGAVWHEIEVIS
jgi:hypothetical protein